jgi:hypothetical protein
MRGIPDYYIKYPTEFVERMKREDPRNAQLAHALNQGLFLGFWFKCRLPFPIPDPLRSDEQRRRIELFNEYKRITSKPVDPIYIRPKLLRKV